VDCPEKFQRETRNYTKFKFPGNSHDVKVHFVGDTAVVDYDG
jgi:hypothetical protein